MKHVKFGKFKDVYKGKIFTVKHCDVVLPNGKKDFFEFCARPGSVNVLAFNKKNELLLIKEYRYGYKGPTWFLPAGRIDSDTPKRAAQRELREETGYRAKKLKLIQKNAPSNTMLWDVYFFAAKDLEIDPLPKDLTEEIEVHFVPFKKAVQMALDGTIKNEYVSYMILHFSYLLKNKKFNW